MKRLSMFLLAALFALLLISGCGGNGDQTAENPQASGSPGQSTEETAASPGAAETQAPSDGASYLLEGGFEFCANGGRAHIMETEDSYYCVLRDPSDEQNGSIIWFSDKQYKDWLPLCGRPDCRHRTPDCNAYLEVGTMSIWLFGDHIYYAGGGDIGRLPQVWRMKLDGTEHELVFDNSPEILPQDITGATWSSGDCYYHESYVFMPVNFSVTYDIEGEDDTGENDGEWERRLYYVDLNDPGEAHEIEFKDENGEKSDIAFAITGAEGDKVWCTVAKVDFNDDGSRTSHNSEVYTFDLAAKTCVKLCDLPLCIDMNRGWYSEGKLWYVGNSEEEQDTFILPEQGLPYFEYFEGQHRHIVCVDTATGEIETTATRPRDEVSWYILFSGHVMYCENGYTEYGLDRGTYIYGLDGELEGFIPYEKYNEDLSIYYIVGDMVFAYQTTNDLTDNRLSHYPSIKPPTYYLDLKELGTDDFNWHKWEP